MALQFTQKEVEEEIADILIHSDRRNISIKSGLGESLVKRQLNPNDYLVPSSIYVALQIVCALDEISPERGEAVWQKMEQLRKLSKPQTVTAKRCVNTELIKADDEFSDIWKTRLNGKGLYQQHTEICETISQLQILAKAVLDEINAEKDSFDSPRTRLKAV